MRSLPAGIISRLKSKSMIGEYAPTGYIEFPEILESGVPRKLYVNRITVSGQESDDSKTMSFALENVNPDDDTDTGYFTPYRSNEFGQSQNEWHNVLIPSRRANVKMGYGTDLAQTFTGEIDDVTISAQPEEYSIGCAARDMACRLIDQTIKVITPDVNIVGEPIDISAYGIAYPTEPDVPVVWAAAGGATRVSNENHILTGTTGVELVNINYIVGSETVYSGANKTGTQYVRNVDYTLDPNTAKIARKGNKIPSGAHVYVNYTYGDAPDIADIVKDLCMRAGFAANDVIVDKTGILYEPYFEKGTYQDAINDCVTVSGFSFKIDDDGKAQFHAQSARSPKVVGGMKTVYLGHDSRNKLNHEHIVDGSIDIWAGPNHTGHHYIAGDDYSINLLTGDLFIAGDFTNGQTVYIDYIYAAWKFEEGMDIYGLTLTLSRGNIYGTVRVGGGADYDGVVYTPATMFDGCKIRRDKVLFADNQYLETQAQVNACAQRLNANMMQRYIATKFSAVGNPWVQLGDSIMVVEHSTTISQVYQITSIEHELSVDGYIMNIEAFSIGYTPN